ncbi:MAG: hypothetical protein VZR02_00550, partial [Lachnospiraceae bacterium]|nr:hypothetical protein [Lachnospiraceae bacterium]
SALRTKAFFLHLVIFAAKAGGENRMRSGRRPLCSSPGCPVNCNEEEVTVHGSARTVSKKHFLRGHPSKVHSGSAFSRQQLADE